jgi:hypothetical protein
MSPLDKRQVAAIASAYVRENEFAVASLEPSEILEFDDHWACHFDLATPEGVVYSPSIVLVVVDKSGVWQEESTACDHQPVKS